jgi:peroxiredoxin
MRIGDAVPATRLSAYQQGEIVDLALTDYRGRWLVVLFYPGDFTFVCPTELRETARLQPQFEALGATVVAVSTDSVWVHRAWHEASPAVGEVRFPLVADPMGTLCRAFDVYLEPDGVALRGSFVVDPDGRVAAFEIHGTPIGRNIEELVRRVEAAKHVRENSAEVCPVAWRPGQPTLVPGLSLVGTI